MRATVSGRVVAVNDATWTDQQGNRRPQLDVFLGADDPRYAPERVSGPLVNRDGEPVFDGVEVGDQVDVLCLITSKIAKSGNPYLSVFAIGCQLAEEPASA